MRVAHLFALFLFLFSLCLKADAAPGASVRSSRHSGVAERLHLPIIRTEQVVSQQTFPMVSKTGTDDKKLLFSVEDEREETSVSRKYVVLAKTLFLVAVSLVFSSFYSLLKDGLPFACRQHAASSCRYLLQRVLRI